MGAAGRQNSGGKVPIFFVWIPLDVSIWNIHEKGESYMSGPVWGWNPSKWWWSKMPQTIQVGEELVHNFPEIIFPGS